MDILLGWLFCAIYILMTAMGIRLLHSHSPALLAVGLSFLGYLALLASAMLAFGTNSFWSISISYWFGCLCFLMVFGAVYKSISLRVLDQLALSSADRVHEKVLSDAYIKSESFDRRLDVILENGYAEKTVAGYSLLPKGQRLARIVKWFHRIFSIERSG